MSFYIDLYFYNHSLKISHFFRKLIQQGEVIKKISLIYICPNSIDILDKKSYLCLKIVNLFIY